MDMTELSQAVTDAMAPRESFLDKLDRAPTLAEVQVFQDEMLELPQVQCDVEHVFADGLASRLVAIPAGTVLVGKMHRRSHMNFLLKGKMKLWSASTETFVVVEAPRMVVSPAGEKRMAETLTDCVWATVHATDAKTPEAMEAELIMPETQPIEGEG